MIEKIERSINLKLLLNKSLYKKEQNYLNGVEFLCNISNNITKKEIENYITYYYTNNIKEPVFSYDITTNKFRVSMSNVYSKLMKICKTNNTKLLEEIIVKYGMRPIKHIKIKHFTVI